MSTSSSRPRAVLCEPLEHRVLCKIVINGEFVITPPGGGAGHETIHLHPAEGVIGLNTAEAHSNGVVNWERTGTHEWTPGDHAGPHQFA
jgi:hypothetical protein